MGPASNGTGSGNAPMVHQYNSQGSSPKLSQDLGAGTLGSKPTTFVAERGGSGGSGSGGASSGRTPISFASSSAHTGFQGNNNNNASGGTGTSVLGVSQGGGTGTSVLGISQQAPGTASANSVAAAPGARAVPAGQKQLAAVVEQSESSAVDQSTLNSGLDSELGLSLIHI